MSVLERVREHTAQSVVEESVRGKREVRARLKDELVQRLGLAAIANTVRGEDISHARRELAVTCEAILNSEGFPNVPGAERDSLIHEVLDEICGLGPIQPLLEDPTITEVMINGCSALFFERNGTLIPADQSFESPEQILMVVDRILAPLGRRLDESSPIVNARLANGDRVNAVASSVAIGGPSVTIRKFSKSVMSLESLTERGSVPGWYATLLGWAVRARQDIAVAGGTGSGKTTLLNALSLEIPEQERIVTVEDSAELKFDTHPNVVRLEARDASIEGSGEVTIRDLVKNALRMRPDRIVVGEVRGEECIDMLQAMNTGHDGSLTTLHAGSPREAVLRLVLMARFGMDLPTDIIEEQIATAVDLLVMSTRLPDGSRAIATLCEVSRAQGGGVGLEECISFDLATKAWSLVREPRFLGRAIELGVVTEEEVEQWRSSCCLPQVCSSA